MPSSFPPPMGPKKGLGLLIAAPDPKGEKMPEESESGEALDMATAGVADAVASKDNAALKDALLTFLDAAGYTKA